MRIIMLTWLLLVSLLCKSTQENDALHCEPQNMTLTNSNQMMVLTWEDDLSCSAVLDTLIYELVVLIAEKQVHYDEVAVMPDQINSTHFWNWTSYLALECASHSVRLRSRYKNQTSPWKLERILLGKNNPEVLAVYPRDNVFKVGSRVTFCCVLPEGQSFSRMYLTGYHDTNMNTTRISSHTYALTVHLNQPSKDSCTNVICETQTSDSGACAYIGYPPDDKDLQCESQDLEYVICHWTVGGKTSIIKSPTVYQLRGSQCANGFQGTCSQKLEVNGVEIDWTLTAENKLGKLELTDRADVTKRVHMFAPENVTVSTVNARNVSLEWEWTVQKYNNLNITCQVNVSYGGTHTISKITGVGLNFSVLNDLIPNWTYNVTVRCGTAQHFWKWSNWSTRVSFHTKGDVPDALDVWMQMKDKQVIIIWKTPQLHQSHGKITNYTVTWAKTTETERQSTTVAHDKNHLILNTTEEYTVTVTATNINGSSSPSTITIPRHNKDRTEGNTPRIIGSNGSFSLSWLGSPDASCGYIVDWCPTSGNSSVEWLRVPPHETHARIFSKNFKDGLRYSLSIYACTHGAPVLLERRQGYVNEIRIKDGLFEPVKWKQQDSDVEVSWDQIALPKQTAFIQGYILYWSDNNNSIKVFDVSTANLDATSLTAKNLKISSYTFTLKAQTAVGECGATTLSATLNPPTDKWIETVLISLVTVFSLLVFLTILCYRHWTCIRRKVYPPIPRPVLTDKWLTSPDEHSCRRLYVAQSHQSEADIMDVPELHPKSGAPVNSYVSHENMPSVSTQTPKGYYNQPLKKCTPPPLTLPTTATPPPSESSPSSFSQVFPNLSYNLIMQTGGQWSKSEPELQEGTSLDSSSSGYHPQNQTETFTLNQIQENPESPMSCVSTYMLLPQSPSK